VGRRKSSAAGGLTAHFILCVASHALFTVYEKEGDCSEPDDCGPLHTVQLGAAEVLKPVRGVVDTIVEPVQETRERIEGAFDNSDEEAIQEKFRQTQGLAAQASRLERENARLRELLEGERSFYEYGPLARVVAPVSDQFTNRIQIDAGSEDGIKPQMPVVVGENTLIGRTTNDVSRTTAQVMLVTDREFAAGVRIIPPAQFDPSSGQLSPAVTAPNISYGEGLLRTNLEGYFGIEYVDLSSRAEKGDYVVTSGRAGQKELLFPPGLFVGTIESVNSQDIDQYKKIVVEPAMDPDDLEEVRVITDWGPGPGVPG
jgi:rod shape-determining protein MreC